jgi:hypothetical protein
MVDGMCGVKGNRGVIRGLVFGISWFRQPLLNL